MKVLVAVKRVIDYNVKARVKKDETGIDLSNVKMSMNPFDEIAVEEAVRLKEKGIAQDIVIASIGTALSQETIRSALALGADRGILVQTEETLEPLAVAKIFHAIALQENPDIILLGKQAIDDDCNQTGQMLAALLDWPQGTFISSLSIEGKNAVILREIDGGLEKLQLTLPAVFTTDLRLNTPRYPTLPNIMKAKQKPLQIRPITEFNMDLNPRTRILKVIEPSPRQGGIKVKNIQDLVHRLQAEAGVL